MTIKETRDFLDQNAFSRIGEVVEINGRSIVVKVDKQKNNTSLFYKGEIYRNVGIGSYVKVKKDFLYIIGKIEKEFIKEKRYVNDTSKLKHLNQYDRFIELSVVGTFENGNFKRGIRVLPLLYNEAYLVSEKELNQIFHFTSKKSILIGKAIFEDVQVRASVTNLFASHIGIFGNTGSGKSNTLVRLYHNLLNIPNINIQGKSKFIILDFNGEYSNDTTLSSSKKNIILSTRSSNDQICIEASWLDEEFWRIVLQATEKTQAPFIKRALNYYSKQLANEPLERFSQILSRRHKTILNNGGINKQEIDAFNLLKNCVKNLFSIEDESQFPEIFRNYSTHGSDICRESVRGFDSEYTIHQNGKIYLNKPENAELEVKKFKEKIDALINGFQGEIGYFDLFEAALGIRLTDDVLYNIAQFDHISPIIHRFQKRKNELKKIFQISESNFMDIATHDIISISLRDVNLEMRKIIPLLLCKKIYENHKAQSLTSKTLHLIIDEAHNILSEESFRESENWKDYRLEVFEEIIKEGRKFGVFLTISSQRPSDISNTIISQLHNVFIHRLINNNDLQTMSKTISFLDNVSYNSIPILPPGGCIFTGTATEIPVAVQIPVLEKSIQPTSETSLLDVLWFDNEVGENL
ncbi:ATP-binding protein [Virgibacillus sp. MG-45]|uniref:ATP-binding protein n=1 Tax=Virgibacillus sp. MG-45 TaxID=3102791 RepID=UPI002EDB8A6F